MAGRKSTRNAADQSLDAVIASDASKEVFAPAGAKKGSTLNTVIINASENQEMGKEVFLIKKWDDGTVYYIDPDHLDSIDRKRLSRALARANNAGVQLWEVLKDTTLSNSQNALEYFHQLVRTFKPQGANQAPTAQEITNRVNRAKEGHIERAGLSDGNNAPNAFL